jgi:hypothetical protein
MATVLEEYTTEEQSCVMRFLWAKGSNAEDIYCSYFYCLPHKAVHNWIERFSQKRSKIEDDARPIAEVAETTVKSVKRLVLRVSTH